VRSAVLWPREHGAWGLLAAPLVLGTAVAARAGGDRWMAWGAIVVAALAVFLARTPLDALLGVGIVRANGPAEVAAARARLALWATVAAVAGGVSLLFVSYKILGLFAAIGLAGYATQWLLTRSESQLVVAVAFAVGAPAAYVGLCGRADGMALELAVLASALTLNQVAYVQVEIDALRHAGRRADLRAGWLFLMLQAAILAALLWAWQQGELPLLAVLGFVPLLARGFWRFAHTPKRVALKRLGFTELAYTAIAVVLIALGVSL
jgi:hypothetical protein